MHTIWVKLKLYSQSPSIKFLPSIVNQASKMSPDPEANSIKDSKDKGKYWTNLFIPGYH